MTAWELFQGMSAVSPQNLKEAEALQMASHTKRKRTRLLLIAAVIALMLLLVGCAVVYVLHASDLEVGKRNTTRNVFDAYHREIVGTEPVSQRVLTFSDLQGSPGYQAAREWFAFLKDYDPDGSIRRNSNGWAPTGENAADYDAYFLYSQEMVDKLTELSQKYNLKLLGAPVEFESMSGFAAALGIGHVVLPNSPVTAFLDGGECYSAGNFDISLELSMFEGENAWPYTFHAVFQYCRKDCLSVDLAYLNEDAAWKEWNYKTASGANVLILRAEEGNAYLFCDCGDATMTVSFEAGYNPETDLPDFQPEWMTDEQVEQVADAIDFTIRPQLPDAASGTAIGHPEGWEIETKQVDFDGTFGRVVFHLTAPKGTDLPCTDGSYVYPQNDNVLIPDTGEFNPDAWQIASWEDGDGRKNTTDIVYLFALENIDDPDFPMNANWRGHLVDLIAQNADNFDTTQEVIAQGVWEPEVKFQNCDLRKIELLSEPITVSAYRGRVTLDSIQVRSMGIILTAAQGTKNFNAPRVTAVLKDGTEIQMEMGAGRGLVERDIWASPVDLDQLAHIRLSDDTETVAIPVPGNE